MFYVIVRNFGYETRVPPRHVVVYTPSLLTGVLTLILLNMVGRSGFLPFPLPLKSEIKEHGVKKIIFSAEGVPC